MINSLCRTSKGAQSAALTPTTSAEFAQRELRRLKLMPFTHSSPSATLVGTTWPPGHMQKEYTLRLPGPGASRSAAAPARARLEPSGTPVAVLARTASGPLQVGAGAPSAAADAGSPGGRVEAVVAVAGASHPYGWSAAADAACCTECNHLFPDVFPRRRRKASFVRLPPGPGGPVRHESMHACLQH